MREKCGLAFEGEKDEPRLEKEKKRPQKKKGIL